MFDVLIALGIVVVVAFIFSPAREALSAPPDHSFGRRVLRDAVRPPAYPGIPMDQDADAPDGAAPGDEKVNGRG